MVPKVLLFAVFAVAFCHGMVNDKDVIAEINAMAKTWKAEPSERFEGNTMDEVKVLMGTYLESPLLKSERNYRNIKVRNDLPENFDLRTQYPNCEALQEIRDQGSCGSCWAFGTTEAMSDRICIQSNQKLQTRISSVNVVSCCSKCGNGCHGGWPIYAFDYWYVKGIPTGGLYGDKNTCQPYVFEPCEHHQIPGPHTPCDIEYRDTPECSDKCIDEYNKTLEEDLWFAAEKAYYIEGEEEIMTEIYERGSVSADFAVYEDFIYYKSGVYQYTKGKMLGGHAIKIIGWGVEDGVKYWLCVNSWNDNWGDKGTFKILRGKNHVGIENDVCASNPKLPEYESYVE